MRPSAGITAAIWCTGQYAQWAPKTLTFFSLKPDQIIDTTDNAIGHSWLCGPLLIGLQVATANAHPEVVVIARDTSSAFTGARAVQ